MNSKRKKYALVTGGSRNIGQGIAIALAENGYDVAITYAFGLTGAEETKKRIEAIGQRCNIYQAHLEQPEVPERVVAEAYRDFGCLDVLVCNAGIDRRTSVLTATAEDLDKMYATNLRNYLLCAGAVARRMVRDEVAGNIILITSTRGRSAHPEDFYYGAIKAAMERATESMALDLSTYGIRVNCVAPGAIWRLKEDGSTPMTPFIKESIPLGRVGTVQDIGEAVAYLVSDKASYITGTTLVVDGGLTLPGLLERYEVIPWKAENFQETHYKKSMEMLEEAETESEARSYRALTEVVPRP